jgi:hypothetical protein
LVAAFLQSLGNEVDDARAIELVGELSPASPHFRRIWARHDVVDRRGAAMTLVHPQVGEFLDRRLV